MLIDVLFINFQDNCSILVHFLVRLCNNKCFFSFTGKNEEFNSLFLGTLSLTVACDHLSTLWELTLSPEDVLSLLSVVEMFKIETDNILPIIGTFICGLSFFVVFLSLLRFCDHDQDRRRCDLIHKWSSC